MSRTCGDLFVAMPPVAVSARVDLSADYIEVRCEGCGKPWTVRTRGRGLVTLASCIKCKTRPTGAGEVTDCAGASAE